MEKTKMKSFKPMLAYGLEESDLPNLKYPLILQPKLDGIRCIILNSRAVSRKLKPIPNKYVRSQLDLKNVWSYITDGELTIKGKTFNEIQSAIMSEDGEPDFTYTIFDNIPEVNSSESYEERRILRIYVKYTKAKIETLNSHTVNNLEELLEWEKIVLNDGHEGIILRSPDAPYKFGRSTLREQALMKFKRFKDSEAEILDSIEQMHNNNTLDSDNLGYAKRSSAKENLVPTGKLGAWHVKDINPESEFYNVEFDVGTGFTDLQRVRFWCLRNEQKGKIIKYKHTPFGSKDKPRSPVWLGMRED